ncbi:IS30 family transposase [Paraburkholderia sp. WSM4179]|nr:IS30 family transposase [Paraburkholderia sp. WSM4179]
MKKNYKHLSAEERAAIMIEHRKGGSIRTIAGPAGAQRFDGVARTGA